MTVLSDQRGRANSLILKGQFALNSTASLFVAEWTEHSLQSKTQVGVQVLPLAPRWPQAGEEALPAQEPQTASLASTSSSGQKSHWPCSLT